VKSKTWDEAILAEHRAYLRNDKAKEAFDALVAAAVEMSAYDTAPGWHGEIRDFRYNARASGDGPFAFIVNRNDLLFYVRLPGLRRVPGGFGALASQFDTANENSRGEWTVRIASKEDAQRLSAFILSAPIAPKQKQGGVPDGITREDVLGAFRRLDSGVEHNCGSSQKYDVVYQGRRYAPKAVVGLAAERLAGRLLEPGEFSGGRDSKSTRILRELGFTVESKSGAGVLVDQDIGGATGHWWVNNGQSFEHEVAGNYVWCPKTNINGGQNWAFDNVALPVANDVVFAYAGGHIRAVGVVTAAAATAEQPSEFGKIGENRHREGWRLPATFEVLKTPLRPKEHMDTLAALLPEKYSPIRANGNGNQVAYFTAVPLAMAAELRRLLGGQVEAIEAKHRPATDVDRSPEGILGRDIFARTDIGPQVAGNPALESHPFADELAEESVILGRGDLSPTQKESLIRARRGQGPYRQDLERVEIGCRLTGIVDRRHLRASHIKPWSVSNDHEKLDPNNGLLLSPHVGHLFDRGYISFTDEGELLVSRALNPVVLSAWGLTGADSKKAFSENQRVYLAYHRKSVFEKHGRGKEFDQEEASAADDPNVHIVLREIVPGSG